MKIVKSNSKTQYNFCGTNKLSFKDRVLAGNSFVPTKQDMSVDALREPGNSYVDDKLDMSDPSNKTIVPRVKEMLARKLPYKVNFRPESNNKSNLVIDKGRKLLNSGRPEDKITTSTKQDMSIATAPAKNLAKSVKKDFNKSDYERCIDGYVQEGLTRDEAKFGCRGESKQVNSSKWDDAYDELDREADKFEKESRRSAKSNNLNSKPKLVTRSSPDSKSKMDRLFADMDNTIKQHCGDAKNCRITEANGQRSVTAWN